MLNFSQCFCFQLLLALLCGAQLWSCENKIIREEFVSYVAYIFCVVRNVFTAVIEV